MPTTKDKAEYLYATGRRKTAVAQVRVYKNGAGNVEIGGKKMNEVLPKIYQQTVLSPLEVVGQEGKVDITVKVQGGGVNAQAEAMRQGISKALTLLNPNFRKPLKKAGYLERDARAKERKKPGLKRARRAPQWSKR